MKGKMLAAFTILIKPIISLLFCCVISLHIYAQSARPILKVGFPDIENYPNEYLENGELAGFHLEMITDIANNLGYDVETVRLPMKRLLKISRRGDIDAVVYSHGNTYDHKFFHFHKGESGYGNALTINSYFLMIKKGRKGIKFRGDLSNIKELKVGVMRGFKFIKFKTLENMLAELDIFRADSHKQLEKLLLKEKIDAAIVPMTYFHRYKSGNLKEFKVLSRPLVKVYSFLSFSKKSITKELADKFSIEFINYQNSSAYIKRLKFYNKLRGLPR